MLAVTVGYAEGIGTQCRALNALDVIDQVEQGRGHVDAVGNDLNGHILKQIDALDGAGMLKLAHVVETGHGIIEMGGQVVTGIPGLLDVGVLGSSVSNRCDDTFASDVLAHLDSTGQLGSNVPAAHAVKVLDNVDILVGVWDADDFRHLGPGFTGVEVGSLHVHAHDGRFGLDHQFVTGLASPFHHVDGR